MHPMSDCVVSIIYITSKNVDNTVGNILNLLFSLRIIPMKFIPVSCISSLLLMFAEQGSNGMEVPQFVEPCTH